ncbi:uncharacterized protein N7511_006961 [Penicillium nucicola]|uniref:uncharacterized protein n=1 Tax=Penicillium nucicola TaxID=1850975 RepID=UPI002544EE7D|nr:uncharacterized protein N7511_006961 [Penicillium nucicola]KAJ5758267.1 hypothetical protein N7511_006961 [Penicillium nucicola]
MAGLTGPELSTMPYGIQPDLMDIPDPRTFLTPEIYPSARRGSCGSETLGSQYAWSTASNDLLATSPALSSLEPSCSGPTSPYMQGYYPPSSMQSSINTPSYSPRQINKWCIETNPTPTEFYSSYPPLNPSPIPYADLFAHESLSTATDWLSVPSFRDPIPIPSQPPVPDAYFPVSIPHPQPNHQQTSTKRTSTPSSTGARPSPARSFSDNSSPPNSTSDLSAYGIPTATGAWRCAHPGCSSQAVFRRGCDLRKHFNRHRKYLFCRHEGCPQAAQNGFSSKKDRARHEAKHNPGIVCEAVGCGRVFSRVDNMKDHVRRIHRRGTGDGR